MGIAERVMVVVTGLFVSLASIAAIVGVVAYMHTARDEVRSRQLRDERDERREQRDKEADARDKDRERDRLALKPKPGDLMSLSSANANHASVTMTNASADETRRACYIATVTHKQTLLTAKSLVVCSGPIPPRSTITLDAPFAAGAIEKLCTDPAKGFTWDACSLEIAPPP